MDGKKIAYFSLFVIFLSLSAGTQSVAQKSIHNTLIIHSIELPEGPDNRGTQYGPTWFFMQYQGYLGMLAPGESVFTMPGIAENWTINENHTEYKFILREGTKLHNNETITAKTVKYSFITNYMVFLFNNHFIDEFNFSLVEEWIYNEMTIRIKIPEEEGRVVILESEYPFPKSFELSLCGASLHPFGPIIPFNSHGAYTDLNETIYSKYKDFIQEPISAGPYMFLNKTGSYAVLERFDGWFGWGETFKSSNGNTYTFPQLDKTFRYIKVQYALDVDDINNMLKNGELDVVTLLTISDTNLIQNINPPNSFSVFNNREHIYIYMGLNIQGNWPTFYSGPGNYPLSEVWFRQAISHAINRTAIVEDMLAVERNTIFPDQILEDFTNINTEDYYNFAYNKTIALEILDEHGYTSGKFDDEPDNRFGWGFYANETNDESKGRHFVMKARDFPLSAKAAEIITANLREVGIYVDYELCDRDTWLNYYYNMSAGNDYNESYIDSPDPSFYGPSYDFLVGATGNFYEGPFAIIEGESIAYWLFYGLSGWYNPDYEIAFAKAMGGTGYLDYIPWATVQSFPYTDWTNNDSGFTEGCEDAGFYISEELPFIPLAWNQRKYIVNENVKNFIPATTGGFHGSYSYWLTKKTLEPILILAFSFSLVILCVISALFWRRKRTKRKK